ncbi:FxsB family cyclophane-forming radical SAM/SPASM peptide maturase [Actinokineospora enzanensis]|uniref:FxsB family cyclophane-forming radical SAM/SPASM peptide maturase n=1 Tax=Actinokineospora enzanensis TaxID=155975 RepID=UPI00036970C3|nr:FxsB family cyclophane-forming radical SAM/SPASM peptide maturase [Actinokineospora enzanensis]
MAGRTVAFTQFVLKLHSRCDLACRYCYVYTKNDQSWRDRPRVMTRETFEQAAGRIAEHARQHRLPEVEVVLHGGEPLLVGAERIGRCARLLRARVEPVARLRLRVQTNGTLLDRSMLEVFDRHGVRVGVSLDGTAAAHDRHRRHADGTGSHAATARALGLLADEYRHLFGGLLCTIDLANDPVETYEALLSHRPPAVDFLLPHGTWSAPPPGRAPGAAETPYADWLIAVYERWRAAPVPETRVRVFEQVLRVLLGGESRIEGLGMAPSGVVVIQTDGAIERSDMLSVTYQGAARTGLSVSRHSFTEVLTLPEFAYGRELAETCLSCGVLRQCGGGFLPHRYRAGHGFVNPSVYCPDLRQLIDHCGRTLHAALTAPPAG